MPELPLPLEFRAEILKPLIALLLSGESAALVGVGSCGKSNIVRHLMRPDVRAHYMGAEAATTQVVALNCKPYARQAPAELYLYLLDQLDQALETARASVRVTDLWQEAAAQPATLAKRNVNRAFQRVIGSGIGHLILLLDDCDDLLALADPVLFSDLREFRDNHKYQLVYLTVTRREPAFLRKAGEFEDFFELFSADGHTFAMGPYTWADASFMFQRLGSRTSPAFSFSEPQLRRLVDLAGGHAGLESAVFHAVRTGLDFMADDVLHRLATNAQVEDDCNKIMVSLESDEQQGLRHIAWGQPASPEELRRLEKRGLVRLRIGRDPELFSPLLAQYLQAEPPVEPRAEPLPGSLHLDFTGPGSQVSINGHSVVLTHTQIELLRYLWIRRPTPCPIGELTAAMCTAEVNDHDQGKAKGKTLDRLTAHLNRLAASSPVLRHHLHQDARGCWLD